MPLAVLLGYGPRELVEIAGDAPAVLARNVSIIGVRDIDPEEGEFVRASGVRGLDPTVAPGVNLPLPGGSASRTPKRCAPGWRRARSSAGWTWLS